MSPVVARLLYGIGGGLVVAVAFGIRLLILRKRKGTIRLRTSGPVAEPKREPWIRRLRDSLLTHFILWVVAGVVAGLVVSLVEPMVHFPWDALDTEPRSSTHSATELEEPAEDQPPQDEPTSGPTEVVDVPTEPEGESAITPTPDEETIPDTRVRISTSPGVELLRVSLAEPMGFAAPAQAGSRVVVSGARTSVISGLSDSPSFDSTNYTPRVLVEAATTTQVFPLTALSDFEAAGSLKPRVLVEDASTAELIHTSRPNTSGMDPLGARVLVEGAAATSIEKSKEPDPEIPEH